MTEKWLIRIGIGIPVWEDSEAFRSMDAEINARTSI